MRDVVTERVVSRAMVNNNMRSSGNIALRILPLQDTPIVVMLTYEPFPKLLAVPLTWP